MMLPDVKFFFIFQICKFYYNSFTLFRFYLSLFAATSSQNKIKYCG